MLKFLKEKLVFTNVLLRQLQKVITHILNNAEFLKYLFQKIRHFLLNTKLENIIYAKMIYFKHFKIVCSRFQCHSGLVLCDY